MLCFSVFYTSLCSRLMIRVTCSHVYLMSLATLLLGSMCLCTFCHVSCLDLHLYMSMCLNALCRVYLIRPRPCLSCHVLL